MRGNAPTIQTVPSWKEEAMNRDVAEIIRNQTPICLGPDATLRDACATMRDKRIGAILVTDPTGQLIGIITGRDMVRCGAEDVDFGSTPIARAMTPNPDTMPLGSTAIDALRLMRDGGYRHMPIMQDSRPVGIVSRGDFRGLEHDRLDVETGFWERIA
jgi:CBS domain-containing protein